MLVLSINYMAAKFVYVGYWTEHTQHTGIDIQKPRPNYDGKNEPDLGDKV